MSTMSETTTIWNIDPSHSSLEFSVRHLMIATVKGRFSDVTGRVVSDDSDLTTSQVEVAVGVNSIDTREAQRDAHLRSPDFFDVEKFPTLTFRSTRITDVSNGTFKLVGDLTMHGGTREIVLDVTTEGRGKDPWGGDRAGFSATTKIKRSDFGLVWNQVLETGGVAVGDEVKIAIDLELVAAQ
ncbi:MAG: polyisoprenoid-binding protein [Luteitalea sp.]|nr:polyisoprenoid-binding protein [Luteitalea sp.]